jgi:alpha-galactosidase
MKNIASTSKRIVLHALLLLCAAALLGMRAEAAGPLKVFILAGQSNMQGHANVKTFDYIGNDPKTAPVLKEMLGPGGAPKVCDRVWISYISPDRGETEKSGKLTAGFGASSEEIGPEFTFGIYMEKLLGEPILIIKTAWGGKSLNTDFRPPGAGPYEFNEAQLENFKKQGKDIAAEKASKAEATGRYYRLMIEHVRKVLADPKKVCPAYDAARGFELAGFVWFQGWNDMVDGGTYPQRDKPGGYDAYGKVLAQFIRDVRSDLKAPKMPFVIGVMGVGGPVSKYGPEEQRYKATHQNFRDAMAAPAGMAEFKGSVVNVLTENCWDPLQSAAQKKKEEVNGQINRMKKDGRKFAKGEEQELSAKMMSEACTPAEMDAFKGISNFGFHYLGSTKILGCIGKAFAEAMAPLAKKH